MKKIEALKNNETGEIEQPQRMLANKGKAGEALYFYRLTQYPQKDYTPIPCLLIEESELKEIVRQIQEGANNIPNSDWSEGIRDGYRRCLELITQLLNQLTESNK